MDEAFLHVTIAAPVRRRNSDERFPVMVYFHGGTYISGDGDFDCYRPTEIVKRGIVAVNVSYRLGLLGYLTDVRITGLPGLQRSSSRATRPVNCSGTCHHGCVIFDVHHTGAEPSRVG